MQETLMISNYGCSRNTKTRIYKTGKNAKTDTVAKTNTKGNKRKVKKEMGKKEHRGLK